MPSGFFNQQLNLIWQRPLPLAMAGSALILLAFLVSFFSASIALGLICLIVFAVVAYRNFPLALGILAAITIFLPEGSGIYRYLSIEIIGFNIHLGEIFYLLIMAVWLWRLLLQKSGWSKKVTRAVLLMLPFLAVLIYSAYLGLKEGAYLTALVNDARAFGYYLIILPTLSTLNNAKERKLLLASFVWGAVSFSLLFFGLHYFQTLITRLPGVRFPGLFNELRFNFRNTSFFFVPLILATVFSITESKNYRKILYLVATLIIASAIIMSQTRTLWLTSIGCLILFLVLASIKNTFDWRKALAVVLVIAVLLTILFSIPWLKEIPLVQEIWQRAKTLTDIGYGDASYRFRAAVTPQVFEEIWQNPWAGVGLGNPVRLEYQKQFYDLPYIDNAYLMITYKSGIPALMFFGLFFGYYFYRLLRTWWKHKMNQESELVAAALISGLVGILVFSFSAVMISAYTATLLIGIMLAISNNFYESEQFSKT